MNWNVFNVAVIGDSLSAGWGWQQVVRGRLQDMTDRPVIFHDFGRPGYKAAQLRDEVSALAARIHPQRLIIECGMNDAGVTTVDDYKLAVGTMINTAGTRIPVDHVILMTMNPAISPASSGVISGVPLIYQGLRDLATARGTGLIDNHPLWTSPTTGDIPDGIHPTMDALKSYGVIDNIVDGLKTGL